MHIISMIDIENMTLDDLRDEVYLEGIESVDTPFFQETVKIILLGETNGNR